MPRSFPSLQSLRVLVAVAGHRNFSTAAAELRITPRAVIDHLRNLEAELGVELFERAGNRILPTVAAAQLALRVGRNLEDLRDAMAATRAGIRREVRLEICATRDFASLWLLPRIDEFYEIHPEFELTLRMPRVDSTSDPHAHDIGISYGDVDGLGRVTRTLPVGNVVVVCGPSFMAHCPDFKPGDFSGLKPQNGSSSGWGAWIKLTDRGQFEETLLSSFTDVDEVLRATFAGHGALAVCRQFVRGHIERGELIQLYEDRRSVPKWVFTWRRGHPQERAIQQFYRWIKQRLTR